MFVEKKRLAISPPRPFILDGTANGIVTVADATGFFVKQVVTLQSNTQPAQEFEIKRFINATSFRVGPKGAGINSFSDISAFTVADNAIIGAPEQDRPGIPDKDRDRAVYAEEPIVAKRVIMVDEFGRYYNSSNPLPIDATFSGTLNVNLDGYATTGNDSVQITGSSDGLANSLKRGVRVDSEYDLLVGISDGPNKAEVDSFNRLRVFDSDNNTVLNNILTTETNILSAINTISSQLPPSLGPQTVSNSFSVTLASGHPPINVTATLASEPIIISGTEDGTPTGAEFTFVNNRLQQILSARDRTTVITWLDLGTKNQRINTITYTAPSIGTGPGFTAVKTFTYTLVGLRYVRTNIGDWSIV